MSNRTINITDQLYDYLLENSVRETRPQLELREVTASHKWAIMQIAPEQGQFMALLVKLMGASQILEIGTFTGYSALSMAQALPADGKITCCDISQEWTDIGRPYWREAGVEDKIEPKIAPALDTLAALQADGKSGCFDLAFIDADKGNYQAYYEHCLTLVRPGGLILFDNTLWNGAVADTSNNEPDTLALRALNQALHLDDRIDLSLLPLGDGLTLARIR